MSRVVVKGIHKDISEEALRKVFSDEVTITDCQLKRTPDGRLRGFAFVGCAEVGMAEKLIEQFNGSFVGSQKITVEECRPLGDASKPRAWSRYSKESSRFDVAPERMAEILAKIQELKKRRGKKQHESGDGEETEIAKEIPSEEINEVELVRKEFLALKNINVVKKKSSPVENEGKPVIPVELLDADQRKLLDEVSGKVGVLLYGFPANMKQKVISSFLAPSKPDKVNVVRGKQTLVFVSFSRFRELKLALNKDGSFVGGDRITVCAANNRRGNVFKTPNHIQRMSEQEKLAVEEYEKLLAEEEERDKIATISDIGRLFLRNLSYAVTEEDIRQLMTPYGFLSEVSLPLDSNLNRPKGFAYVTFMFPEHALRAYSELDGTIFKGRMLHVLPAKEKPVPKEGAGNGREQSGFKGQRDKLRKADAGLSYNWNTLFLGTSAVADVLASKLSVAKSAVLDVSKGGALGVRMALGETQVVQEAREFLLQHGVALDCFSNAAAPRSRTVILAKNLSAGTTDAEVREMFGSFGELGRVVLPPAGVTAIVEFLDKKDAAKALKTMAYKKFKTLPLLLEWAPGEVFSESQPGTGCELVKTEDSAEPSTSGETQNNIISDDGVGRSSEVSGSELYVKNLDFTTTEEMLSKRFRKCDGFVSAQIATKAAKGGTIASLGYGWVKFVDKASAKDALTSMQGKKLNGRPMDMSPSVRQSVKGEEQEDLSVVRKLQTEEAQTSTKICVRNVPFQATAGEIRAIFQVFGELKTVRLPKKMGSIDEGAHRGFAFVDFATKADAKRAFDTLCHSTHLYGRRLVLQWAKRDETVDEVRKRTAEHFVKPAPKKFKKAVESSASSVTVE